MISFTVLTSKIPARLTKKFSLDSDGNLAKESGGNLVEGLAETKEVADICELSRILSSLTPAQAVCWGVCGRDAAKIVTKDRVAREAGAIARDRAHFYWNDGPGVLMVDYDPSSERLGAEILLEEIHKAVPELIAAPTLIRDSASSYIYNEEKELIGAKGTRILFLIKEAQDIERVGEIIFKRTALAGHARIEIAKNGAMLIRGLVDDSVYQPFRLDFEAGALCVAPLEQRRPSDITLNGKKPPLDTSAIANFTWEEEEKYSILIEKLKKEAASVSENAREIWIEERIEAEVAGLPAEKKEEKKAELKEKMAATLRQLPLDQVLFPESGGQITVRELIGNPTVWHDHRFHDPIEPEYGKSDPRIALATLNCAEPFIFSHAHGGQKYMLEKIAASEDFPDDLPGEAVEVAEASEAAEPEEKIIFPIAKIHPIFGEFWREAEPYHEARMEYVCVSMLVGICATVGNKMTLRVGAGLKPNLYALLLGDSTFMKKSSSMRLALAPMVLVSERLKAQYKAALEFFKEEQENWTKGQPKPIKPKDKSLFYPAELSPEMLLEKMQDKPDSLFSYSEFGGFLANMESGYMSGFKEKLTDFYDGTGVYRRELKGSDMVEIKCPAPSIIACSTPQWLQAHLKQADMLSGFLARFLFVRLRDIEEKNIPIEGYIDFSGSYWEELFQKLNNLPETNISLSIEATSLYSAWYEQFKAWAITQDRFLHSFLGRLLTTCHKIALANHAMAIVTGTYKKTEEISAESYARAFPWIAFFALNICNCYQELTQGQDLNEIKVLEIVRHKGTLKGNDFVITQSKLWQYSNMKKKDLVDVLENLKMKEQIKEVKKGKYTYWTVKK